MLYILDYVVKSQEYDINWGILYKLDLGWTLDKEKQKP